MKEEKFNNIVSLIAILLVVVIILMAIFLDIGTFFIVLINLFGLFIGVTCLIFGYFCFNENEPDDAITLTLWGIAIVVAIIFIDKAVIGS
jgi:hypothetical protein